jgi:DNA invertase Pin-like site-specific DNA recombinase
MENTKPKDAGIYVRVSTDNQEAENQLLQLREYCRRKGYNIHREYIDIMSGAVSNRPGFNEAFKDAHAMAIDVLVFWDISRFSRAGTLYTLQKLRELDNIGVEWDSFQDQYFQSVGPFKDVVISIMATLARIEREKISERTKAGLERAKKYGKTLGRPAGSKDKRQRKNNGYLGNKNWTSGVQKKVGRLNPKFQASNSYPNDQRDWVNKRAIVREGKEGENNLK